MEVTFQRAMKIWWSFIWRAWVMGLLLVPVIAGTMFLVMPKSLIKAVPGMPPEAIRPEQAPIMILVCFMMLGLVVLIQSQAMRWMLKTKWSDFKLQLVPTEPVKDHTSSEEP